SSPRDDVTVFTHAALPLLFARRLPRKLLVAAVVVSVVQDLDVLAYLFDVQPPALLAHRGLTHSLLFAALLAAPFFRDRRAFFTLFAFAASHGLLDAFTQGDVGVALLAPWPHRFLLPVHPVPVIPLGADEVFSRWGLLVLFNEALLILAPLALFPLPRGEGQGEGARSPRLTRPRRL